MIINKHSKFLIIGLGLLGGSYARALTEKGYYVEAITLDQKSVDFALDHQIVNGATTELDTEMINRADVIIFALYPNVFVEWVKNNGHLIKPGTLVTDVTGVKKCIVYEIQRILKELLCKHQRKHFKIDFGICKIHHYIVECFIKFFYRF